ncbi:pyridoxamine 5'-phosphate oxidase family protein, partial [Acinetobacter baumannii]
MIASARPDGQPVSVATWYLREPDGRILVNMDETRRRVAYLREDPRVTLTVLDGDNWYTHLSVQGRVVEWKDDPDLVDIDRLAKHYR